MGDPKFPSKHYNTPSHPWQKNRIDQERTLTHQYGLKSKKEIWKADTKVREMRRQARKLTAKANDRQAQKEKNLLKIERVAVLLEFRRLKVGSILIKNIIEHYMNLDDNKSIILHSQVAVENFYKSLNFNSYGNDFFEDGIPHIAMKYVKKN